jgi:hypothetical protein
MTDSLEQGSNPWQEPPEGLLQGIFEFFMTLEDGEPLVSYRLKIPRKPRHLIMNLNR